MTIKDFVNKVIEEFDLMLINMACKNGEMLCEDIETYKSIFRI